MSHDAVASAANRQEARHDALAEEVAYCENHVRRLEDSRGDVTKLLPTEADADIVHASARLRGKGTRPPALKE